jgi:hypothetical protein
MLALMDAGQVLQSAAPLQLPRVGQWQACLFVQVMAPFWLGRDVLSLSRVLQHHPGSCTAIDLYVAASVVFQ